MELAVVGQERRPPIVKPSAEEGWNEVSARDLVRVPGLLSLARLPLAALFPLTLGRPGWGIGLLALAGATDLLDGWYARHFHQQTSTGALVDGATDKVFVITVVASLVASGAMSVSETVLLCTRDLGELAIGLRLAADRRRHRPARVPTANTGGKLATTPGRRRDVPTTIVIWLDVQPTYRRSALAPCVRETCQVESPCRRCNSAVGKA
ncbi:MAG: hypothetical protein K0S65_2731 [Labilithrix sp.]|nr:hypothetical protein [Labilithrix sp.]